MAGRRGYQGGSSAACASRMVFYDRYEAEWHLRGLSSASHGASEGAGFSGFCPETVWQAALLGSRLDGGPVRPRTPSQNKTAPRASDSPGALRALHQSFATSGIERSPLQTYLNIKPNGDGSGLGSDGEAKCRNLVL